MATPDNILLLGSTGPTSRLLLAQALERGHTVTALVRHAEDLPITHPRLRLVLADLAVDTEALGRVVPGHDVVISALGRGQSLRSHGLMARLTPGIVAAMEAQAVPRLLLLSAFGVGGTAPEAPWVLRLAFRTVLGDIYADKAIAEDLICRSSLEWTIIAPVKLTDKPETGRFRAGAQVRAPGFARLTRADAAAPVLNCLADAASIRQRYVVAP